MEQRERQFTTIHLASDHAGFTLKEEVRAWLSAENFLVVDHGSYTFEPEDDFPDFIMPAAVAVAGSAHTVGGIIFGGSGQGEALAANRTPGVRAVVYYGGRPEIAPLTREHNDANILSLGARFISSDEAKAVIWEWLHTPTLSDEKFSRRNGKIDAGH